MAIARAGDGVDDVIDETRHDRDLLVEAVRGALPAARAIDVGQWRLAGRTDRLPFTHFPCATAPEPK